MRYLEFKKKIQDMPLFFSQDLNLFEEEKQVLRNQIRRWQEKGFLIKLKKGIYILNKDDRKIFPSRLFIANQLYSPSYISLEYALNFYGLIPEGIAEVTSITTRKTKHFHNELGTFIYRHIQKDYFIGFTLTQDETGLSYFIASPEKAVVDFFYFELDSFQKDFFKIIEEGYRFQNVSELKKNEILKLAGFFKNKKLLFVCKEFCEFIRKESK